MVLMQGVGGIYFTYSVAIWAASTSCGGSPDKSLHLGVPFSAGFVENKLKACVSDQLGIYPGDATMLLAENAHDVNGYTYSTYQCLAGKAPGVCTTGTFPPACTFIISEKENKYNDCVQLGKAGSFMFQRKVSQPFYAAVFCSIFIGGPALAIMVLLRMGYRCENGRCVRPDRSKRLPEGDKAGDGGGATTAVNPTSVVVAGGGPSAPPPGATSGAAQSL